MTHTHMSRRSFLATAVGTAAAASLYGFSTPAHAEQLVFVAVDQGIHTMEPVGTGWRSRAFAHADTPQALALGMDANVLYAAEQQAVRSVTAYRVLSGGQLRKVGSSPLALSSGRPYSVAVSADGRLLAAASEGGVVSLLPIASDSQAGPVVAAYKDLSGDDLHLQFGPDGLLRMTGRELSRAFHVSADNGFVLASTASASTTARTSPASFGIANARAVVCHGV
ncbi:MAG: beta-propeller fold lactonase family protein [Terriglobus sp.]